MPNIDDMLAKIIAREESLPGLRLSNEDREQIIAHIRPQLPVVVDVISRLRLGREKVTLKHNSDFIVAVLDRTLKMNLHDAYAKRSLERHRDLFRKSVRDILKHYNAADESALLLGEHSALSDASKAKYRKGTLTYDDLLRDDPYSLIGIVTHQ